MRLYISILITVLILFTFSAQAQSDRVSFKLHSGLNAQTFSGNDIAGEKLNLSYVPRFNVGVMIDYSLGSGFYIKSGLLFNTKGTRSKDQFQGMNLSVEYNVAYAEIPLSILYKLPLGNNHIIFGFGPYLSYGIIGNVEYTFANTTVKKQIEFTNEYESLNPLDLNNLKPFDYGGNLFLGYEFNRRISMQLNTQVGMANIQAENRILPSQTIFKNIGYGLSIEYKF
jgi:hypothetical protein